MEVNTNAYGWIYEIGNNFIKVKSGDWKGIIKYCDITDYSEINIGKIFSVNEKITFRVLEVKEAEKRFLASFKDLHMNFQKDFGSFELKETDNAFKNLLTSIIKEYDE
ncbi:30S ribosomal protein s1 [Mycoplasmopsis californica]|uniref:30S ribosomal protein S1 n=1 Tax=Mycoplasmopsis equigenitalium TaxID=114883 RepID=A0ABY5J5L8_9BACT|nr:hypothetical protein [Mycoplasmopsis equigenitalium]UUD37176.1 hypothetical protein NPA09_01210 [Mycoplasmopsis equigenitalium]VEU69518.1 30S ribosomal protein s1 [Mycoplasmopsis californica]